MPIGAAKDPSSTRARGRYLGGYLEMARDLAQADAAALLLREPGHGGLVLCARDGNGCAADVIDAAAPLARQLATATRPLVSQAGIGSDWAHGPVWSEMGVEPCEACLLVLPVAQDAAAPGALVLAYRARTTLGDRLVSQLSRVAYHVAAAVGQLAEQEALAERLRELDRRHHALEIAHSIGRTINRAASDGGGLAGILAACHELTGKPVAVFDRQQRLIARVPGGVAADLDLPPISLLLARIDPNTVPSADDPQAPRVVRACPGERIPHRHLLTPVVHAGVGRGWLTVVESVSRLGPVDELTARRAAEQLGCELAQLERVAAATWNARSALARQLIGGTSNPDDLRRSGEYLGVDVAARRVLSYLSKRSGSEGFIDDVVLAKEVERRLGSDVLATRGSEGVVLLTAAPAGMSPVATVRLVKATLDDICRLELFDVRLVVGVSAVAEPQGLRRAYRDAREVARCMDRFANLSSTRVLAVDDLGPARLFLANSDDASVRRYVDDVLGPLLTGSPTMANLLMTLQIFFDTGRSIRVSAAQLGVHQNTVRLRLGRVQSITGLDVASGASDQLSVQTALLVLRLQGHPALPAFEQAPADDTS
jgi:sugar diacid utilization regulator